MSADDAFEGPARAARTSRSGTDPMPVTDVSTGVPRRGVLRRRRPRQRNGELYYVGRRPTKTSRSVVEVYVVNGTGITRLTHRTYKSDEVFDWGSVNPGALELAYAMLADSTYRPVSSCRVAGA